MKRAVISLIVIMVMASMLLPANAQDQRPSLPKRPMLEGALIMGHIDDAYRQFWGSSAPIEIRSKKFTARNIPDGKENVFEGTVKVVQDDVTLTCDKLVMLVTANRSYFTASGNVIIMQGGKVSYRGETQRLLLRQMK